MSDRDGRPDRGLRRPSGPRPVMRMVAVLPPNLRKSSRYYGFSSRTWYAVGMKSYNHYCAVAKALDAVGDRWTLLIIRELVSQGPCRYTDLMSGLPGIATNLLADRLAFLEETGIVWRESVPPPVASTLYHLTEAGADLKPVLDALGIWGIRFMSEEDETDQFRGHWFKRPVSIILKDRAPDGPPMCIQLSAEDHPAVIEASREMIRTRPGRVDSPDLELAGPPHLILGILSGRLSVKEAKAAGLTVTGKVAVLNPLRRDRVTIYGADTGGAR
jgi:DNA-binding HxlR family transcriptional regulator